MSPEAAEVEADTENVGAEAGSVAEASVHPTLGGWLSKTEDRQTLRVDASSDGSVNEAKAFELIADTQL